MEDIIAKVEAKFNGIVEKFEKEPIKTTLKAVVTVYIVKKVWSWLKS